MSTPVSFPQYDMIQAHTKYLDYTNKLNDFNEIQNLNRHLHETNTYELDKMVRMNDQIRTKLLKLKQEYLLIDFAINEYNMYIGLAAFTILMVCIALYFVVKTTNYQKMIIICVILGVIYLFIVIIILGSNIRRRKYAWNQWYWYPMVQKK